MARQRTLQSAHAPAQQAPSDLHVSARPSYLEGGYMTADTAARFLDFPSARAFIVWAKREQIQLKKRGRRIVVLAESCRAALKPVGGR